MAIHIRRQRRTAPALTSVSIPNLVLLLLLLFIVALAMGGPRELLSRQDPALAAAEASGAPSERTCTVVLGPGDLASVDGEPCTPEGLAARIGQRAREQPALCFRLCGRPPVAERAQSLLWGAIERAQVRAFTIELAP